MEAEVKASADGGEDVDVVVVEDVVGKAPAQRAAWLHPKHWKVSFTLLVHFVDLLTC